MADSCCGCLFSYFGRLISLLQTIPKDDRHELIKCKEYLKETEARREQLDLRIDANRAALFVLRKNGEKNVDRCVWACTVPWLTPTLVHHEHSPFSLFVLALI